MTNLEMVLLALCVFYKVMFWWMWILHGRMVARAKNWLREDHQRTLGLLEEIRVLRLRRAERKDLMMH